MNAARSLAVARPNIESVSAAVSQVPSLPDTVRAVIAACERPDGDSAGVAALILSDQGLTANLLRLVNSAAIGGGRTVATVSDAVVILGMSAVKSLAISVHTATMLTAALPGYALRQGELWRHSLLVATICRALVPDASRHLREEAFVAGLLHDIGKVVLADFLGDAFDPLLDTAQLRRTSIADSERELLGFDHAELGARIADNWQFPAALCEAIGLHHRPERAAVAPALAAGVAVANTAAHALRAGIPTADLHHVIDELWLEQLALTPAALEARLATVAALSDPDHAGR